MADKLYRAYIAQKLDPILHPMATKTFLANPDDHVAFMLNYLKENHGHRPGISTNERMELDFLRKEVVSLKNKFKEANALSTDDECSQEGSSDDDSEEEVE